MTENHAAIRTYESTPLSVPDQPGMTSLPHSTIDAWMRRSLLDDVNTPITDGDLVGLVVWPNLDQFQPNRVREMFDAVKRFIDFDGTIAVKAEPATPRQTICGQALRDFLGQEPFIVQTLNPPHAMKFFREHFPDLPQPVMIISVPTYFDFSREVIDGLCKDFSVLGIVDALIVDDEPSEKIRAPGCRVMQP